MRIFRVKITDKSGCPAVLEVVVGDTDTAHQALRVARSLVVPGVEVLCAEEVPVQSQDCSDCL